MLMRCLAEPEASSASALSIRRLCDGCAGLLAAGSMEPLLQLYRQVQGSGDVAANSFDFDLDEDDVQQVRAWPATAGPAQGRRHVPALTALASGRRLTTPLPALLTC